MRILLISYWFPPTNAIGALRVGKFAKYLHESGHDVRVLAGPAIAPLSLPLQIPPGLITRPPSPAVGQDMRARPARHAIKRLLQAIIRAVGVDHALTRHYRAARTIPDKQIGWRGQALADGRAILAGWRPDVIVASAPPYTGLLVAKELSRACAAPWVADIRDPWADSPYSSDPDWRAWIDRRMERRTLARAAALVSVSPIDSARLRGHFAQPVTTILNGFSPEDTPPPRSPCQHATLRILHTGTIYVGHRDPSPLFAAMRLLDPDERARIEVMFRGAEAAAATELAVRFGVGPQVVVLPPVDYAESLRLQSQADVLLLLQRSHITDVGNIPAKFFEYIAARRPILLIGCDSGVVADMIRERDAGFVSTDPTALARMLRLWLDTLPQGPAALPASAQLGLRREEQFADYERFLAGVVRAPLAPGSNSAGSPIRPPSLVVK